MLNLPSRKRLFHADPSLFHPTRIKTRIPKTHDLPFSPTLSYPAPRCVPAGRLRRVQPDTCIPGQTQIQRLAAPILSPAEGCRGSRAPPSPLVTPHPRGFGWACSTVIAIIEGARPPGESLSWSTRLTARGASGGTCSDINPLARISWPYGAMSPPGLNPLTERRSHSSPPCGERECRVGRSATKDHLCISPGRY